METNLLQPRILPTLEIRSFSFSPSLGFAGTEVRITGNSLSLGVSRVAFAGVAASMRKEGADIIAVVPTALVPGAVSVALTYVDGIQTTSPNSFTVIAGQANPVINSFFPASGQPGALVQLNGAGFTGVEHVYFNGVPSTYVNVQADTNIVCSVPQGATDGFISVQRGTAVGFSNTIFDVTTNVLSITSFSPGSGITGDPVFLTGNAFNGVTAVRFNGISALYSIFSDSTIKAFVPGGNFAGKISVEKNGQVVMSSASFLQSGGNPTPTPDPTAKPAITNIFPRTSFPGGTVRVTGTNLGTTTMVSVGGFRVSYDILGPTSLDVHLPDFSGSGRVTVTNPAGSVTSLQGVSFF
jgi:hypothetical protein